MKTTVQMIKHNLYVALDEQGNKTSIDMRPKEQRSASSPMELVLSALGACGGVDIMSMLEKRKKTVSQFTIDVEGTQREDLPKSFTEVHCCYKVTSPDVGEEELHKVAKMAIDKYCSVAYSLKAKMTFSVEIKR